MNGSQAHDTFELAQAIVYGPVSSRRLGRSLGVNVLPPGVKVCSFNCNYCQCGWTYDVTDHAALARHAWPTADEVAEAVGKRLIELRQAGERLDCLTFAGNGEPTLHPHFDRVAKRVVQTRDNAWPGLTVDVLSNGANCGNPRVVEGLNLLDERYMKLDAGSESVFLDMNAPVMPIGIWDIIQGLRNLRDCVIQAMFTRGRRDNTTPDAVDKWIGAVAQVNPKKVHLYSIARAPADPKILAVDRATLDRIRAALESATGIRGEVF